ncbi:MAG: hypothetical protein JJU40_06580 [Rhodobacteraceae bacterium]|nr:hypothetical protein [Paracoccaceae bacterium]
MSAPIARPSRPVTGLLALALVVAMLALDLARTPLPDPFSMPPPLALGSGQAPGGAHCSGG